VLGPAVANRHFHGAAGWAAVLVAIEAGVIVSGIVLLRWKPRRMLRTATFGAFGLALPLIALARPEPLVIVIVAAFASGYLTEIFGVLWDTTYQQEIPQDKLSRLSAYDAIGSWALMPLGFIVAGPVGTAVGTRATFIGGAIFVVVATGLVFLSRDVRMLERREQPA
jgi:predicted MFS family arabinose efflux permease